MKKISYYDLLGMIKEENIPDKVYLHMLGKKVAYIKDVDTVSNELTGYMLDNPNKDQDENFKYYLGECFLESDMFDECIEVDKKLIEKIKIKGTFTKNQKRIIRKINEIIEVLNEEN